VGSSQHLVECGTLRLCATNSVGVFVNDFKSALFRKKAQIKRLCLRILIAGGNSGIQNRTLHLHNLSSHNSIRVFSSALQTGEASVVAVGSHVRVLARQVHLRNDVADDALVFQKASVSQ
jgi:hypothetical protein